MFIQVNIGDEDQKSGINLKNLSSFFRYCTEENKLNVIGLMAIPPNDGNEEKHFKFLYDRNLSLGLKDLSMGMSGDYMKALKFKSTFLRIGSSIFQNLQEKNIKVVGFDADTDLVKKYLKNGKRVAFADAAVSYTHLTLPTKRIV